LLTLSITSPVVAMHWLQVRTQASTLLGNMVGVSEDYLMQTFDKTVMSHLRKKKTEHELMKEKARGATGTLLVFVVNIFARSRSAVGIHELLVFETRPYVCSNTMPLGRPLSYQSSTTPGMDNL
jgi:hypothetical protein